MYDWKPIVEDLISRLLAKGFSLGYVYDGGYESITVHTIEDAVDAICAVDDSYLYVLAPYRKTTPVSDRDWKWVKIVLGNGPDEIVNDYTCDPLIDQVTAEHAKAWEDRPIPTIEQDNKIRIQLKNVVSSNSACNALGLNPWCVNEGANGEDWIDMTANQAKGWGLI